MSDRTESLLAELVELHKRQLAISEESLAGQREALAGQRVAIERQQLALVRQKNGLRVIFALMGIVFLLILVPYAYSWLRYLSSTR